MEPKHDIRIGPHVLRRQPPVAFIWCQPPKANGAGCAHRNATCGDGLTACRLCGFSYCSTHFPLHSNQAQPNHCPVDIWRHFGRRLGHWQRIVKYQHGPLAKRSMLNRSGEILGPAPVVGQFCLPPNTRNSHNQACAYPAATCTGPSTTCLLCGFPSCTYHVRFHCRPFECPPGPWSVFEKRRKRWFSLVQSGKRRFPRVDVRFPLPKQRPGDLSEVG